MIMKYERDIVLIRSWKEDWTVENKKVMMFWQLQRRNLRSVGQNRC